jgi:hypothetical protein
MKFLPDLTPRPVLDTFVERGRMVKAIPNQLGIFVVSNGLDLPRNGVEKLVRASSISPDGVTAILDGLQEVCHVSVDQKVAASTRVVTTVTAYGSRANEGPWASVAVEQTSHDEYSDLETTVYAPLEGAVTHRRWGNRPWTTPRVLLGSEEPVDPGGHLYPALILAYGMNNLLNEVGQRNGTVRSVLGEYT